MSVEKREDGRDAAPETVRAARAHTNATTRHPDLPRDPSEGPHPVRETLDALIRRKLRFPRLGRLELVLDGDERYRVVPATIRDGVSSREFTLTEVPDGPPWEPVYYRVSEMVDPEDGCREPKFYGLTCTCRDYSAEVACGHIRSLTALGLLIPACDWDDPRFEDFAVDAPPVPGDAEVNAPNREGETCRA